MNNPIRTVLAAKFADREVAEVSEMTESGHPGNQTARIRLANEDIVFLKVRVDGDAERNEREVATTRFARSNCEVRVPHVVDADSMFDPPYLAVTSLEGTPASQEWKARVKRAQIARELGQVAAGIAAATFGNPGWITGGDETHLNHATGDWSTVLAEAIMRDGTELKYPDRFEELPDRASKLVRKSSVILDGAPAALVHQDIRPDNVFRNGQPGVIDWEWTLVGDPGLCLCWAEEWVAHRADVPDEHQPPLRDRVRRGFRVLAGELPSGYDRRRPIYRVVTFLPKARTFNRWAPDAPESTEELAEWVRSEINRRIGAAEDLM